MSINCPSFPIPKNEYNIYSAIFVHEATKFELVYFKTVSFRDDGGGYMSCLFNSDAEGYLLKTNAQELEKGWTFRRFVTSWGLGPRRDGAKANIENTDLYNKIPLKKLWVNMKNEEYISHALKGQCVPPTPEGGESGQTDNSSCSNTGQFGGGGTRLQDIKLFLYANNVTKGTIKLSKPQVEVGTFATDWRPNPSDYVERNSPAYKEIKGLAIQHNQEQNKKFIEVQTTDGTVYGVDIWGGDAKKQLEQQQKEIEELKKIVQTLESKINV